MFFFKCVLILLFVLLGVAFFTLFERKILGYSHNRFGPNKVGIFGGLQPFSDALKLFTKEYSKLISFNYLIFIMSPILGLLLMLILWLLYGFWGILSYSFFSFIIFFCVSSVSIYFLLLSGWSSGSKYSFLGSYRSSSQSISYEVSMVFCFLIICLIPMSFSFNSSYFSFFGFIAIFMVPSIFFCWVVTCLAECNRSPFDFSEGESELVSGFNTEFGGGLFSLIFIGEYASILFLSFLTSLMFFLGSFFYFFFALFISFIYLWVRSSFPRLRYDKLMMMSWKGMMMYMFGLLFFFVSMVVL